jgi:hypothetical protein
MTHKSQFGVKTCTAKSTTTLSWQLQSQQQQHSGSSSNHSNNNRISLWHKIVNSSRFIKSEMNEKTKTTKNKQTTAFITVFVMKQTTVTMMITMIMISLSSLTAAAAVQNVLDHDTALGTHPFVGRLNNAAFKHRRCTSINLALTVRTTLGQPRMLYGQLT